MWLPDVCGYELDQARCLLQQAGWQVSEIRKALAPALREASITGRWRVAKIERLDGRCVRLTVVAEVELARPAPGP